MLTVTWDWKVVGGGMVGEGLAMIKMDAERSVVKRCDERRGLKMILYNT